MTAALRDVAELAPDPDRREAESLARAALEEWAWIERLRAFADECRARGDAALAFDVARAIRPRHVALDRLASALGLPPLQLGRDIAAFARAQLGLPIDAPADPGRPPRQLQPPAWIRDLSRARRHERTRGAPP